VLYANWLHLALWISDSSASRGGMPLDMVSLAYPKHLQFFFFSPLQLSIFRTRRNRKKEKFWIPISYRIFHGLQKWSFKVTTKCSERSILVHLQGYACSPEEIYTYLGQWITARLLQPCYTKQWGLLIYCLKYYNNYTSYMKGKGKINKTPLANDGIKIWKDKIGGNSEGYERIQQVAPQVYWNL